jgi:hypothetical protein
LKKRVQPVLTMTSFSKIDTDYYLQKLIGPALQRALSTLDLSLSTLLHPKSGGFLPLCSLCLAAGQPLCQACRQADISQFLRDWGERREGARRVCEGCVGGRVGLCDNWDCPGLYWDWMGSGSWEAGLV